jgi:hypothetical protein
MPRTNGSKATARPQSKKGRGGKVIKSKGQTRTDRQLGNESH